MSFYWHRKWIFDQSERLVISSLQLYQVSCHVGCNSLPPLSPSCSSLLCLHSVRCDAVKTITLDGALCSPPLQKVQCWPWPLWELQPAVHLLTLKLSSRASQHRPGQPWPGQQLSAQLGAETWLENVLENTGWFDDPPPRQYSNCLPSSPSYLHRNSFN